MSDARIYKAIMSLQPVELPGGKGRVLRHASITRIAAATAKFSHEPDARPMPRRTVAHRLEAMERKGILQRWQSAESARTSPFGTSWHLPTFHAILQRWADDPDVGTIPPKRAFYTIGKGRRLLTPAEVEAWSLNHGAAEQRTARYAIADLETPSVTSPEAETERVLRALLDHCDATPKHAADLLELARRTEPSIPVDSVCNAVRSIALDRYDKARAKRETRPVLTVGWFTTGMEAAVHRWRHERDRAQDATRAG